MKPITRFSKGTGTIYRQVFILFFSVQYFKPFNCHCLNPNFKKKLFRRNFQENYDKQFQCLECDKKYTRQSQLNLHHLQAHSNNQIKFQCQDCGKFVSSSLGKLPTCLKFNQEEIICVKFLREEQNSRWMLLSLWLGS